MSKNALINCQTSGIFQFTLPSCIFVRVKKKLLEYIDNTIRKSKKVVESAVHVLPWDPVRRGGVGAARPGEELAADGVHVAGEVW